MRLIALSLLFLAAACQQSGKNNSVRVAGEGKVRVMPNQVILTLDVSFVRPRMVDAVRETQQTIDTVLGILEQFGRRNLDIKTSSISANKSYEYVGNRDVFKGFSAGQTVDFVLNDISRFTELTGRLLETKINSIAQIQFGHSKADSLFREADLLAYDDAHKSATKLSQRAGVSLGKLRFISNTDAGAAGESDAYQQGGRIETYSKAYGGRGFRISPEVLEFRRMVVAEYEVSE